MSRSEESKISVNLRNGELLNNLIVVGVKDKHSQIPKKIK